MQKYNIEVNYIPDIPQIPYRNGVGEYEGVTCHCTDSSNHSGGDTPTNERLWEVRDWQHAFVHYFVGVEHGAAKIIQTADTAYKAWHAGPYGNERFVGIEWCMYDDPKLFEIAYDAYCYLIAKVLHDKKLGVSPAQADESGTLWSHKDVSDYLGGSDHQDPIHYLNQHGISWSQHVEHVKAYYDWMSGGHAKDPASNPASNPASYPAGFTRVLKLTNPMMHGEDVRRLQVRLNITADSWFGSETEASVKMWQTVHDGSGRVVKPYHGLEVDGEAGPRTLKALFPNG